MGHRYTALMRAAGGAARMMGVLALVTASASAGDFAQVAPRLVWQLAEPARGIPAHDSQSAFFLTHTHELVAASLTSGRVRWRALMDATASTFGSRVIIRGDVVVGGDYDLMGFDRGTGARRWTFVAADGGGSAMHLGEASGEFVFSGSLAGALHAVSSSTGQLRWSARVGPPATTTVYAPVTDRGLVAASFTQFGPAAAGGVVVVDETTGRVRWRRLVPASTGASGNPVFAGETVMVPSRDGTIHAFGRLDGRSLWRLPKSAAALDDQDYRPLAVSGRTVIAGSLSGEVVAYDMATRRERWRRTPTVASVAFDLAVAAGIVYVPYFSNQTVALRVRDGTELWRLGGGPLQARWRPSIDGPRLFVSGSRAFALFRHNGPGLSGR